MGLLDALIFGVRDLVNSSDVAMMRRSRLKVIGGTLSDDGTNTVLTIAAGGGATTPVPMRSSAVPTVLVSGVDYHLTMTTADPVTLPTAPPTGTPFEVKGIPAGVTLTPGGADTIELGASYVMVAGECQTMRYNAASTNWELC